MSKAMNKLMLSCKKATELIEKQQLTPLRFVERMQLKMHKSMCDACSAYEKQSIFIDKALNSGFTRARSEEQLSEEAKERIIKNLTNQKP